MQTWVEEAVSQTIRSGSAVGGRRSEKSIGRGKKKRTEARATGQARQVVARVEAAHLGQLQTICEAQGIQLKTWLLSKMESYIEQEGVLGSELLGRGIRGRLRNALPSHGAAREEAARLLLTWPESTILEAFKFRPRRLREAIKVGDLDLASEILEVANLRWQVRQRTEGIAHKGRTLFSKG